MGHVLVLLNGTTLKLLLLLLLLVFVFSSKALNITKFCVENPHNTLCVYPDVKPDEVCEDYESIPIDEPGKRDIVKWHLEARENITGVEPSPKIYWNTLLALMAQKWASMCKSTKDANLDFDKKTVYQNIFHVRAVDGMSYNLSDVLKMYDYPTLHEDSTIKGIGTDIFKNISLWKSFRIGCGMSKYTFRRAPKAGEDMGNSRMKVYEIVCNYIPLGRDGRDSDWRALIKKRSEYSNSFAAYFRKLGKNSSTLYGNGYKFDKRYGEIQNDGRANSMRKDGESEGKKGNFKYVDTDKTRNYAVMKDRYFEETSEKEFDGSEEEDGSLDLGEFDEDVLPFRLNVNNETRAEFQRYLPPDPTVNKKQAFVQWVMHHRGGGCLIKREVSTFFACGLLFFILVLY